MMLRNFKKIMEKIYEKNLILILTELNLGTQNHDHM